MCSKMKYNDKDFHVGGTIGLTVANQPVKFRLSGNARRESKDIWLGKGYRPVYVRMTAFQEKDRDVRINKTDRVAIMVNMSIKDARIVTREATKGERNLLEHNRMPVVVNPKREIVAFA